MAQHDRYETDILKVLQSIANSLKSIDNTLQSTTNIFKSIGETLKSEKYGEGPDALQTMDECMSDSDDLGDEYNSQPSSVNEYLIFVSSEEKFMNLCSLVKDYFVFGQRETEVNLEIDSEHKLIIFTSSFVDDIKSVIYVRDINYYHIVGLRPKLFVFESTVYPFTTVEMGKIREYFKNFKNTQEIHDVRALIDEAIKDAR